MERRRQRSTNGNAGTQAERTKRATDDCGQIDSIIGGFGKYQLMIFIFKILIGATSAFNNLGVTFFAPSDFVSFWCADNLQDALQQQQQQPALGLVQPNAFNATTTTAATASLAGYGPSAMVLVAPANNLRLPRADGDYFTANGGSSNRSLAAHAKTVSGIMGDFVFNTERVERRASASFDSDTPRRLRKECDYLSPVDNERHKCTSYQYDTGIWISTIIDEWNLVCDRSLFISITQSLYMAGFIVSFLMFGYLSDRFGRWNSLLLGAIIEIMSGFGCAFSGSVCQFMVFRFLLGLGNAGRSSSSYLIMIEWTGQAWRMHISTLGSLGWVFGYCSMPWIVMYFLHFRHMQLFVCFYESVFLLWLLFLPESPRWLLTHKRFSEAYEVLLKAAKFNGLLRPSSGESAGPSECNSESSVEMNGAPATGPNSFARKRLNSISGGRAVEQVNRGHLLPLEEPNLLPVPVPVLVGGGTKPFEKVDQTKTVLEDQDELRPYTLEEFDAKFAKLAETIAMKEFTKNEDKLSILDLFRWRNLRRYTFILAFAWAVNSFIYYGIALNVGDFGGKNLFVSFSMAGATELPSIFFTMICMKMFPRRTTNVFLFATIFLLCALQVPLKYYELGWLQQSTMILAKLFNSCSFTCILYQTMELFPTSIRQTAYSSCSLAGRIGSILAPFIKELSRMTNNLVPPVIYAVLSLMEIALIRHLPETQGSDLPDTLLEAEKFKGTDGRRRCERQSGDDDGQACCPATGSGGGPEKLPA